MSYVALAVSWLILVPVVPLVVRIWRIGTCHVVGISSLRHLSTSLHAARLAVGVVVSLCEETIYCIWSVWVVATWVAATVHTRVRTWVS